jgi:ribosome-associated protein
MPKRAAPHRGLDVHYGDAAASDDGDEAERPSKTALKDAAKSLQVLGQALADLPEDRLAKIAMDDTLRAAFAEHRRTRSHEGRRRHMQYIGKLMRTADEAALREALAEATLGSAQQTLKLHELERWRDELIADDEALARWLAEHPGTDTQRLRSLIRAARRDAAGTDPTQRQPRSARELFQFLKPLIEGPSGGAESSELS